MAPAINFIAGGGIYPISNLAGSGLGFYGPAGFGVSVPVGQYQSTTFITDATGAIQGPETNNVTYLNSASGIINQQSSGIGIQYIPNYQAPLNIQFTNDTAVKTTNTFLMIYDRLNTQNAASGVHTQVAQLIHPNPLQTIQGSGDSVWTTFTTATTGLKLSLVASPGTSGLSPNGPNTTDVKHDWYIILSASPDSIGSKSQYGLFFQTEYL